MTRWTDGLGHFSAGYLSDQGPLLKEGIYGFASKLQV